MDAPLNFDSWQETRDFLRDQRNTGEYSASVILQHGVPLLAKHGHKLGNEEWLLREQLVIAGLDEYNHGVVKENFDIIKRTFPVSKRHQRLRCLLLEGQGMYADADKGLQTLIAQDPTDLLSRKRHIAIFKSLGKHDSAIVALNKYLKLFMADDDAWQDLADLYTEQCQYNYATHCLEELLISDRFNVHIYTKYADLLYTSGDSTGARKYYAYSLSISSSQKNARALHGLCLACSSSAALSSANEKVHIKKLFEWAELKIVAYYAVENKEKLEYIKKSLSSLRP